jgi:hypothetical protein
MKFKNYIPNTMPLELDNPYNDVQKLDTLYNDVQQLDTLYNDVRQLVTRTMTLNI